MRGYGGGGVLAALRGGLAHRSTSEGAELQHDRPPAEPALHGLVAQRRRPELLGTQRRRSRQGRRHRCAASGQHAPAGSTQRFGGVAPGVAASRSSPCFPLLPRCARRAARATSRFARLRGRFGSGRRRRAARRDPLTARSRRRSSRRSRSCSAGCSRRGSGSGQRDRAAGRGVVDPGEDADHRIRYAGHAGEHVDRHVDRRRADAAEGDAVRGARHRRLGIGRDLEAGCRRRCRAVLHPRDERRVRRLVDEVHWAMVDRAASELCILVRRCRHGAEVDVGGAGDLPQPEAVAVGLAGAVGVDDARIEVGLALELDDRDGRVGPQDRRRPEDGIGQAGAPRAGSGDQ